MQALLFSNAAKITVILMVSFGVYLNALPGAFVYDDPTLIEQNPWLSCVPPTGSNRLWNGPAGQSFLSRAKRMLL